ncbi:PREDICTED: calpain-9-like [Priapulus caudatus]|uniref:Calpain-9-like n=1 Tax=Priapulus caudatus TaxID=37621 RepID=A0ABM1F987_PRICU|nr:PREDICTED: calpain-9-like [Priapulus caudatus]
MMSSSAYNGNGDSDNRSIYSSYSTLTIPTACSEYARLKQETFASGILFEDHDFPADVASLYHRHKPSLGPIVWKRPREICQNPKFITKSATRFDIKQGQLGDCWLLTAVSCLTITPRLFRNVVPPNQFFHRNYAGMFVFRFWQYGEWVEVCVDDRLPTYQGQLVYMHSGDPTEFWCSLLEKAYAKLYGSYEALNGSYTAWALQDLTGGVAESYGLDQGSEEHPTFVYTVMGSVIPRSSLLAASIVADDRRQKRLACGLLTQHTYSVTGIATDVV